MMLERNSLREGKRPPSAHTSKSGLVPPHSANWKQRLSARMVFNLLRAVAATLRYRWDDRSGILDTPAIYCIWHNRLALSIIVYRRLVKRHERAPSMAALVSASRDGGFLSQVLKCFKVQPVRGSSSRRGGQALLELTTWAERGYDLAITPDGPRGPRYRVQDGVTSLAQLTGLPIVPVSLNLPSKICTRSWDRFQIPMPFSVCEVILARPILVPGESTDEEREALRIDLERVLKEITRD